MNLRRILMLLCLAFAGLAVLPWLRQPMTTAGDFRQPQDVQRQTAVNFNDPGPLAAYEEILQRPAFVASRRPTAAIQPTASATGEVLLLDRYPVVGVVVAGGRGIVLIRKAAGDTVSRLEQGATLDGWTLTHVSRNQLVLEMAGQRKEVDLQKNGGSVD